MQALSPARLPTTRFFAALSLEELEPVRALRICLLGYRSQPYGGGQGVYLRYLSKALVELGHRVDVISGEPYPHLDERVRLIPMPGMNLYEKGLLSLRPRHLRSLTNLIEWFSKLSGGFAEPQAFGRRVLKYLDVHHGDYDLVHDNQSLSYAMLQLQERSLPLVTTIHHPISSDLRLMLASCRWWWPRLLVRRWYSFVGMQKRVALGLHNLITVSECSRRDVARDFGVAEDKLTLVYNGVDSEVFAPEPAVTRKPLQLMATASADQPLKGLRILLLALAQLLPTHPGLRLLVVGKPRAGGDTEKLVAQLGIGPHIDFVSAIPTAQLVSHYAEATLVVVPSLYEGFGLPAAEAMACGCALISSDGGALPEVVGDAGVLVPAGDHVALATEIEALLADPGRRAALGQRARARILETFCWHKAARQMTRYYEQVLAAHANCQS